MNQCFFLLREKEPSGTAQEAHRQAFVGGGPSLNQLVFAP
jgi:hypothetical protein